jgi:hypothetical protein
MRALAGTGHRDRPPVTDATVEADDVRGQATGNALHTTAAAAPSVTGAGFVAS